MSEFRVPVVRMRYVDHFGRLCLKMVSEAYLLRKRGTTSNLPSAL